MARKRKTSKASNNNKDHHHHNNHHNPTRRSGRRRSSRHNLDDFKLRETMESDGLTIVEMNSDGNCLFRAISDQLFGDYGDGHDQVRADICDFMESKEEEFKLFLVFEDDEGTNSEDAADFESYIAEMREDATWGGNLELVAAARLYQRRITVYSASLSAFTIDHDNPSTSGPDLLVSFHDGDHYNSVRHTDFNPNSQKQQKTKETTISNNMKELSMNEGKRGATTSNSKPKPLKKNSPCPCGSGKRYGKCHFQIEKKQKAEARTAARNSHKNPVDEKEDDDTQMKGTFRAVQI